MVGYSDFRLAAEIQKKANVVITGGAAVQLFTRGGFLTGDVDLALVRGESPARAAEVLEELGFQKMGNVWIDEKGHHLIQVVGPYFDSETTVDYGDLTLRTVCLEYLIADRISKCSNGLSKACEQALVLLEGYGEELDMEYLRELLKRFGVDESFLSKSKLVRLSSR